MSGDKVFIDTNIFIYMYTYSEPQKRELCLNIIDTQQCVTSIQALNEISNVLTKKIKIPFRDIRLVLNDVYNVCEVNQIQKQTIYQALSLKEKYGFSFYDCLMLASALENGCKVFYTEDMSNGQTIEDELTIENPFLCNKTH